MTTLEAWEKERERHTHGVEDTADLIVRLNAKAIVEAYRAGKEAGDAERDRLWEALKLFVKLEDVQRHYPIEVALARAVLGETEGKE
jgi:hypothetical protein